MCFSRTTSASRSPTRSSTFGRTFHSSRVARLPLGAKPSFHLPASRKPWTSAAKWLFLLVRWLGLLALMCARPRLTAEHALTVPSVSSPCSVVEGSSLRIRASGPRWAVHGRRTARGRMLPWYAYSGFASHICSPTQRPLPVSASYAPDPHRAHGGDPCPARYVPMLVSVLARSCRPVKFTLCMISRVWSREFLE